MVDGLTGEVMMIIGMMAVLCSKKKDPYPCYYPCHYPCYYPVPRALNNVSRVE